MLLEVRKIALLESAVSGRGLLGVGNDLILISIWLHWCVNFAKI